MKAIANMGDLPAGSSLLADDILEFHAARILLLIRCCGKRSRSDRRYSIQGLTKLAKLDFFVRYPEFFNEVARCFDVSSEKSYETVESRMVRYHYGPWDQRYYHVLAYLEGRKLLEVHQVGKAFQFILTNRGTEVTKSICDSASFEKLCNHMKQVKKVLGEKSGSYLKNLIYKTFEEEVARQELGEIIDRCPKQ